MKEYSTIKELVESLEEYCGNQVIDGWKENKCWVSVFKGDLTSIKNPLSEERRSFQKGGFKIKVKIPC
jgi:hypothetical protein